MILNLLDCDVMYNNKKKTMCMYYGEVLSNKQTSSMQNIALHTGHVHLDDSHVSGWSCSCRNANLSATKNVHSCSNNNLFY